MQTCNLSLLANFIWQQRAPEAAQVMTSLIDSCTCFESERAISEIEAFQSDFVTRIFHHPLTAKFMQTSPALLRCVRLLVDKCDSMGADIDDDIANFMATATCASSQIWLYRLFPLNPELELQSLCESNVCIAKVATCFNQVGLSLWTAGFCLIEACLGGVLPLSGKVVCEVGAGVGMTAVALHKAAASFPRVMPARLIMTDYCAQVLENMDSSISSNGIELSSNWKNDPPLRPQPHAFIVSDLLDVRDPQACADFALLHQPEVFIGADITYDPVLIKDICSAMLAMMKAVGRSIDVFITATVRTQSTFQNLLECAAQSGFDVDTMDISGRPRLFRVDDGLVRQLKLCARPEVLVS